MTNASQKCPRSVPGVCQKCPRSRPEISQKLSQKCPRSVPEVCRSVREVYQKCSRSVSEASQKRFRSVPEVSQCDGAGASGGGGEVGPVTSHAPPLEALRSLISLPATSMGTWVPNVDPKSEKRTQISFIELKRPYFNAEVDQDGLHVFVNLPAEDPDSGRMRALLLRHTYGTRIAADGWQEEYSTLLVESGFRPGEGRANIFHHERRCMCFTLHGDDVTAVGPKDWLD